MKDLTPAESVRLVSNFAEGEPVLFLGPGFGPLFERFTGRPKGSFWQLVARKPGEPVRRPPSESSAAANEQLWQQRWSGHLQLLARRAAFVQPARPSPLLANLRLEREQNATAALLTAFYSRALNEWGVELRRLGRAGDAEVWFERALALNPDNLPCRINLQYSQQCRRGDFARLKADAAQKQFPELFGKETNWRERLWLNGPVDEPTFLFRTGRMLLAAGQLRQSASEFARSAELAPEWVTPRLWLAQTCIELHDFAGALKLSDAIQSSRPPEDGPSLARLLDCRASALRGLGRTNEAASWVESVVSQSGTNREILLAAADFYEQGSLFERELALLDRLLEREPNRPDVLLRKGRAQVERSEYEAAIATLTTALSLAPTDDTRLCRAIACLGADKLEDARADYERLLQKTPHLQNALFGLATIAWREQKTNTAIRFYEQFLSNAAPGSAQYAVASTRLKRLGSNDAVDRTRIPPIHAK